MLLAYSISTDWPQQIKIKSIEGKTECPINKKWKSYGHLKPRLTNFKKWLSQR